MMATPYEKFSYEKFSLGHSKNNIQEIRHPKWLVEKFNNAKNRLPLTHVEVINTNTEIVKPALTKEVANQEIVDPALPKKVANQEIVDPETIEIIPTRRVAEARTRPENFMPRGMRRFHPYEQEFVQQVRSNLSKHHQATIDELFDNEARFNVSYNDFSSLWQALGGSIKNCKGSHKALKDANGKTVAGIFAHGNNMTYTKKTIPYLRAALELIGISADPIN